MNQKKNKEISYVDELIITLKSIAVLFIIALFTILGWTSIYFIIKTLVTLNSSP